MGTKKKFKLGKREANGLHRVIALRSFGTVAKGEVGGFIEKEANLSHEGNAWVYGDARVFGNVRVYGNALVYGDALVFGNAWVYGDALVSGRFDVQCAIDFELPRVTLSTTAQARQLRDFLVKLDKRVKS